jgi:hypothetical protein
VLAKPLSSDRGWKDFRPGEERIPATQVNRPDFRADSLLSGSYPHYRVLRVAACDNTDLRKSVAKLQDNPQTAETIE